MTVDGLLIDLDTTHTEKDLGVYVDDNLKFDFHIHTAVTRANRMLGLIKRSYTFLDKESLLCLYKAMVRPILEYGVTVWSPYRIGDIDAVESVQRRATRIPQYRSARPGLRSAGILLNVPMTRSVTYGDRAFCSIGPTWWNSLPSELKTSPSVDSFKRNLKTHLFKLAYGQ